MPTKPAKTPTEKVEITVTELDNGNIQIPWIDGRIAEFRDIICADMEAIEQLRIDHRKDNIPTTTFSFKLLELLCVGVYEDGEKVNEITTVSLRSTPARQFKGVMEVFAAIAQYFRLNDIFDDGSGDADVDGDNDDGGSAPD
jgi:hypothetical protein